MANCNLINRFSGFDKIKNMKFVLLMVLKLFEVCFADLYKYDVKDIVSSSWSPSVTLKNVLSPIHCSAKCISAEGCSAFYYDKYSSVCELGDKLSVQNDVTGLTSDRTKRINVDSDDSWIVILGGFDGTKEFNNVELRNWKTGKACTLQSMPYAAGGIFAAFFNGILMFCGGYSGGHRKDCYKYQKATDSWIEIAFSLFGVQFSTKTIVPSKGLVILEGSVAYPNAAILPSISEQWTDGPGLYQSTHNSRSCAVQLDDFTTVYFGGNTFPNQIVIYDWRSNQFFHKSAKLIYQRSESECAILKVNGKIQAVIAGSSHAGAKGLEVWDPVGDAVQLLVPELPQEKGQTAPLGFFSMLSVSDNSQLIFLNGKTTSITNDIWKFDSGTKDWQLLGSTSFKRGEFSATLVQGIRCK